MSKRYRKAKKDNRIGKKISILRHENVPEKQAVGEAEGMAHEGRLTPEGGYKRGKRSSRRKARRRS
jgi:hypothetical protein